MASSASGQDEPKRALWLATRAGKIEPSCPLRITCLVPQAKFPQKPYNKSFIDQICLVKMAGYWPRSFFACLCTSTSSRSINTQKKELCQYSAILTSQLVNNPYLCHNQIKCARSDWSVSCGLLCRLTHGKIARLLNYYTKAIDHKFLWDIYRLTHSANELSGFTCTSSLTMDEKKCGIENFEFIVSERVQLNPDNSRAMGVLTFLLFKFHTLQTEIVKLWVRRSHGVMRVVYWIYATGITPR